MSEQIEFTQHVAEMRFLKEKMELERKKITSYNPVKTDLNCSWCNELIDDEHYYLCKQHKNVFCDFCAHNKNRKEVLYKNATKCKVSKPIDCIWEKISLKDEI